MPSTRTGSRIIRFTHPPYKRGVTDLRAQFVVKDNTGRMANAVGRGAKQGMEDLGRAIVMEAKRQATIDPKYRTGNLYRSIYWQVYKQAGMWVLKVGAHAFYGFFLEFGTRRMLRPHPFLRPAYLRSRPIAGGVAMRWMKRYVEAVK